MLDNNQITDYLIRVVEPQLATIPGVQNADILGARTFAMRIWLKPDRLTAHNVTASDVYARIREHNVLSAVGETKGNYVAIDLSARTDLRTPEEFRQLVVTSDGESVVRLGDVADVVLGSETYDGARRLQWRSGDLHGHLRAPRRQRAGCDRARSTKYSPRSCRSCRKA